MIYTKKDSSYHIVIELLEVFWAPFGTVLSDKEEVRPWTPSAVATAAFSKASEIADKLEAVCVDTLKY